MIGFFTGFIVGIRYAKRRGGYEVPNGKILAWIVSLIWISFHIYTLIISGERVATVFDVIGAMAVGSVIGFDAEKLLERIFNIKK